MLTTRRLRHATVAAASAAAAASWAVVTNAAGVHLTVRFPHSAATTVGLGTIVPAAVTTTLLGWGILAFLETRVTQPRKIWTIAAVGVLLMSLAIPIAFATTTAAAMGLVTIHLAVAAVAITGLAWLPPLARMMPKAADAPQSQATHSREYASPHRAERELPDWQGSAKGRVDLPPRSRPLHRAPGRAGSSDRSTKPAWILTELASRSR